MVARSDYGSPSGGGRIVSVEPGSPAQKAGILPGFAVVEVDGAPVADLIDWRWYTDGVTASVIVEDQEGKLGCFELERELGESWGIDFGDALFDRVRTCRNDCVFCFMAQLPDDLRPALYVRDDDFRLSFLQGNFVTLTNLSDDDVARIIDQRLSPLYVSLHATEPGVRQRLICAHKDDALERLDELLSAGITFHIQVVLLPGVNDGEGLDKTLTWLEERSGIESVGIVPLGYTRYQDSFSRGFEDSNDSALVLQQIQKYQFQHRESDEYSWVHLADEFYLNARAPFPVAEWYDGFPQYENGIGIVRTFVDEVLELRESIMESLHDLPSEEERLTLVTGMMAANTLAGALDGCGAVGRVRLLVVPNGFFGGNVSVAGLLSGRDVVSGIARDSHDGIYVLPDVMFNADGLTIDDMSLANIRAQTGADIRIVSADAAGLLSALEQGVE